MIIRGIATAVKRLRIRSVPNAIIWWGSHWGGGGATIGDVHAVENLSRHLSASDFKHIVVSHLPLIGVENVVKDWRHLPSTLRTITFVCGPIIASPFLFEILDAYPSARKIAVGVSALANQSTANARFDEILTREDHGPGFDLALARFDERHRVPTGGDYNVACFRGSQSEYGPDRLAIYQNAEQMLLEELRALGPSIKEITTVIDPKANKADDIVQSIERAQIMATTRMHAALYALMYGRAPVAVDQIPGGAKVSAILQKIGWPLVFRADSVEKTALRTAFEQARSPDILAVVERCRAEAISRSKKALSEAVKMIAQ